MRQLQLILVALLCMFAIALGLQTKSLTSKGCLITGCGAGQTCWWVSCVDKFAVGKKCSRDDNCTSGKCTSNGLLKGKTCK